MVSRVNPYAHRASAAYQAKPKASSTPIKSGLGYMTGEDQLKRAQHETEMHRQKAAQASFANVAKAGIPAPDAEIYKGTGAPAIPSPTAMAAPPASPSIAPPPMTSDTIASPASAAQPDPGLVTEPAPLPSPEPISALDSAPRPGTPFSTNGPKTVSSLDTAPRPGTPMSSNGPKPRVAGEQTLNPNAHSPFSSKSSKTLRETMKSAAANLGPSGVYTSGPFVGLTPQQARQRAKLRFHDSPVSSPGQRNKFVGSR